MYFLGKQRTLDRIEKYCTPEDIHKCENVLGNLSRENGRESFKMIDVNLDKLPGRFFKKTRGH